MRHTHPQLFTPSASIFVPMLHNIVKLLVLPAMSNRELRQQFGGGIWSAEQPACSSSEQPARPNSELRQQSARNLGKPSGSGTVSAEQPACSSSEQPVTLNSVHDVRRWLWSEEVASSNINTGPVREVVAALTRTPRPRKEEAQPLQSKWGVAQKNSGTKAHTFRRSHQRIRAESC